MSSETVYESSRYRVPEITHCYGENVHLIDDPLAWTLLARACAQDTGQPQVGWLVRTLYEHMARHVIAAEFPRELRRVPSRMVGSHPEAVIRTTCIAHRTPAVCVGIARAGTVPSQVVYDLLNEVLDPSVVRQDYLFMSRETNDAGEVIGARWHDAKIGREVGGKLVLFPDPMGATGSSMSSAVSHYKTKLDGVPKRCIAMHLIVTPEYLRRMHDDHPDVVVYALRLDRGLSAPDVLTTTPGERWAEEKGLNEHQYIVPGAGGMGELLNNSWV